MANIEELQKALDNKALDTSKLDRVQKMAIDQAFKSGALTGYGSIQELQIEQGKAAETLAEQKEKELRPFQAATQGITPTGEGIERADFELIGDVTGSLIPYFLDANKISDQMIRSGAGGPIGAQSYALRAVNQNTRQWGGLVGKLARYVGRKTPVGKVAQMLPRTAATLQRVANFGRAALQQLRYSSPTVGGKKIFGKGGQFRAAPTQLLHTELKSQLLGMGGAGTGSALYGMAEAVTDIGAATQEDLANVSAKEIDTLPPLEREIVHASEAMKNAMIYNGLGFGLMPMLSATFRGIGNLLGLNGKQAKIFAEEAYKNGYYTNLSAAMDQNKNFFARFFANMMKTIGVFPLISGGRRNQRRELELFNNNKLLQKLDAMAPLEEAEWLSLLALNQMRKNFKTLHNSIARKYEIVDKMTEKIGPELRIIPTGNIRTVGAEYMSSIRAQYPEMFHGTDVIKGQSLTEFDDPLVKFLRTTEQWSGDQYLTMKEYIGLFKILTNVLPTTKIQDPRGMIHAFRAGLKKDLNSVVGEAGVANVIKRKQVKDHYDGLLSTSGKPAADAYVVGLTKDLEAVGTELLEANRFFHDVVMPYAFTPTAKKIKSVDPKIFTNLGLLGIASGKATIDAPQLWSKTIKQIMSSDNAKAIMDLKWMLGYNDPKNTTGKKIFDRFRAIWMENAWNTAFTTKPVRKSTTSIIDLLDEAKKKGVLDQRFVDDINNDYTQDAFIKGIDPDKGLAAGIGRGRFKDLQAGRNEVQQFKPYVFEENLGFSGKNMGADEIAAARSKFKELFGGGEEGLQALKHIDTLIGIMKREVGVPISDTSTFLQRRFTLGSFRSVLGGILPGATIGVAGAGVGGLLGSPLAGIAAFVLLARKSGMMLGDPKMLQRTYDLFTNLERMQNSVSRQSAQKRWKLFAQWWNYVNDEFKDAPEVDPNKIAFEEIGQYLLQQPTTLLQPNFTKEGLIKEMQNRAFFAEKMLESATPEVIASGSNFLTGSLKALDRSIQIDEADAQATLGTPQKPQLPDQAKVPPAAANAQVPGQGVNAGQNVRANYAQLFPQDTLGQAIANRNAQQG